jgi:sugar/nucleoside kinase (ribokinase family)
MDNQPVLLSIGDATIDIFMTPTESESSCQLNDKDCHICFTYGDKIPVKNVEFSAGGNASNNAVGAVRLGIPTSLVLTLGNDSIGNQIVEKLASEGIDLTYVTRQQASSSNFSVVINYSGERTIFTYHAPKSYEFPVKLPIAQWVYLTSMGETYKPFYNHMLDWLRTNTNVKLAFNPGSWQLKDGLEGMGDVLKLTHIVYLNREEAEKLTGLENTDGKEKELLTAMFHLGPRITIITDGTKGSMAFDGTKYYKCNTLPVDAYERTGAGDAFGSAFLSAIIKGKTLNEALIWGTVNSASVIGYTGPQRGLLKESEMPVWLERAKSSGVKVEEF